MIKEKLMLKNQLRIIAIMGCLVITIIDIYNFIYIKNERENSKLL